MKLRWMFLAMAIGGLPGPAWGAESSPSAAADPELPQAPDWNAARSMLANPPFTREINLSDTLVLTGLAYVQGKPVATLTHKRTKQNYLVTTEPNHLGWKLAEASPSSEPGFTQVKMYVGGELVTIHFGEDQLVPGKNAGQAARWRSLTDREIYRTDENGKTYVRGSIYLPDADRERYYNGWSREAHDKFRDVIRSHREQMFRWSHEERAAFAKKVFDSIDAADRARSRR